MSERFNPHASEILNAFPCHRPGCLCQASINRGKGFTHCPAHHPDENPSLDVTEKNGTTVFICRSQGCAQSEIVSAMKQRGIGQTRKEDSIPPRSTYQDRKSAAQPTITPYEIKDVEGRVIAIHERRDLPNGDKKFTWRRPDGTTGLGGRKVVSLPLYGSHRLNDDPEAAVVLVEGEKTADSLTRCGFMALGTVTGSKQTPSKEGLEILRGREVYIWPDNDMGGKEHMERIAASLSELGISSLWVEWTEAQGKDDAADFIIHHQADATEAVDSLLQLSREWKPPQPDVPGVRCLSDVVAEEVSWLWYPLIPLGKLTIMEGDPGVGKSWVTLAIASAVSHGSGLRGMEPQEPANVLLFLAEDGLGDTVKPRLVTLGANTDRIFAYEAPISLDAEGLDQIQEQLTRYQPKLVIVDPVVAFIDSKVDLHRANETRQVFSGLFRLAEKNNCAFLLVRHLSKGVGGKPIYRGLGSIDIIAAVRSALLVGIDADTGETGIVHTKSNLAPLGEPVGYVLKESRFEWTESCGLTADRILSPTIGGGDTAREEASVFLQEYLADGPRSSEDVFQTAAQQSISKRTLNRAKRDLGVKSKPITEPGKKGAQGWLWHFPQATDGVTRGDEQEA